MALPKAVVGPLLFCLLAVTGALSDVDSFRTDNDLVAAVGEGSSRRMLPRKEGKHLLSATVDVSEEHEGARRMLPRKEGKHLLSATVDLSEEHEGARRMLFGNRSGRHLLEDVADDVAVAPVSAGESHISTVTGPASTPQPDQANTAAGDPATSQAIAESTLAAEDAAVTTPTPVVEVPTPRVLPAGAVQITAEDLPDCSGSPDECAKAFYAKILGQSGSAQQEHGAESSVQAAGSMAGISLNYAGCESRYDYISCNDLVLCGPKGYVWPHTYKRGPECDCLDFCRAGLGRPFGVCWAGPDGTGRVWYSITTSTGAIYCDPRNIR